MAALCIDEIYDRVEEFSSLLAVAELEARTDWEVDFTTDMRARFKRFGPRTTLTDFQRQALERLAKQ
ncbi:hypothetical protein D3C77_41960 [compost metagenome]